MKKWKIASDPNIGLKLRINFKKIKYKYEKMA
jgi:hypothetical protein